MRNGIQLCSVKSIYIFLLSVSFGIVVLINCAAVTDLIELQSNSLLFLNGLIFFFVLTLGDIYIYLIAFSK